MMETSGQLLIIFSVSGNISIVPQCKMITVHFPSHTKPSSDRLSNKKGGLHWVWQDKETREKTDSPGMTLRLPFGRPH